MYESYSTILPSIGMVRQVGQHHILSWIEEAGASLRQEHVRTLQTKQQAQIHGDRVAQTKAMQPLGQA